MDATFASTAPSGSDAADATPDRAPRWITRDTAGMGSSSPSSRLSRSSIPVGSSSPPWKSAWSRARSRASHRANTSLDPFSRVFTATSASKSRLASFHSTGYGPFSSRLSIAMTLAPLRRRRSTTWLPMNPAAPVTSQAPSSGSTPLIVDELSPADADITRALLRRAVRAAGCIPRRRGAWYRSVAASVACADMPTAPPRGDGMAWYGPPARRIVLDGSIETKISAVPLRSEKTSEVTPGPPFATPGRAAHQAPTDGASADGLLPQSRGCRRRPDPRLRLRIGRRARDDDATSGILVKHLVKG